MSVDKAIVVGIGNEINIWVAKRVGNFAFCELLFCELIEWFKSMNELALVKGEIECGFTCLGYELRVGAVLKSILFKCKSVLLKLSLSFCLKG